MPVLLGAVGATGLPGDGTVEAVPTKAQFLAPLAFFGGSYALGFPFLIVGELGLRSAGGALALVGAGPLLDGLLAGFAKAGFGVASIGRLRDDENAVERTAYCHRVRAHAREIC